MYEVKKDLTKKRIHVKLQGFIEMEEAQKYTKEMRQVIDSFQNQPFTLLADLSELKTSSTAVADEMSTIQEYARSRGLIKSAAITPAEVIGTMQVKRYAKKTQINEQYFTSKQEAETFLDEA